MIDDLNVIAEYLARRDIKRLDLANLGEPADVLLLTGSCLLGPLELAAQALREGVVKQLLISGGIGHSTQYLRDNVALHPEFHLVETEFRAEADIMYDILVGHYEVNPEHILVENESTNCGENAEFSKRVLDEAAIAPKTLVLVQDPTMQRRTHASCERFWQGTETKIVSFAPFIPGVEQKKPGMFGVHGEGDGVWNFDRLLSLIQGEIVRLRDDENGYGPKGKNYIDHIEVPEEVLEAYARVADHFKLVTR